MSHVTPDLAAVAILEFIPAVAFAFWAEPVARTIQRWPAIVRTLAAGLLAIPYLVLAMWHHIFDWKWLALYCLLPVGIAWLLSEAARRDPEQRGNWRDLLVLLALGLAVDLRWFDPAWPAGLRGLGNFLLVDAGLYGFLGIRQLSGTGFDFHFRWSD